MKIFHFTAVLSLLAHSSDAVRSPTEKPVLRGSDQKQRKAAKGDLVSSMHMTVIGNPMNNPDVLPRGEYDSTTHEVRCCSDTPISGWKQNAGCSVWAHSNVPTCMFSKNYDEAKSICTDAGGRLCSFQELVDGCAAASGCGHDDDMIWAADSANYWAVCGKTTGECSTYNKPSHLKEEFAVRCCSDTAQTGWIKNSGCSVWAESDFNGQCYDAKTLTQASTICSNQGGRLCTKEELEGDCTKGTGCYFDHELVWSSTLTPRETPLPTQAPTASPTRAPQQPPSNQVQPTYNPPNWPGLSRQ